MLRVLVYLSISSNAKSKTIIIIMMSIKAGSQYDATLTQRDAGCGINYAGIGSISNPASRCVALR